MHTVGVIGGGMISQIMYLPYLFENQYVELKALVESNDKRRKELGSRYSVESTYSNHEGMLEDLSEAIDCCFILTPTHTHKPIAVDTLENDIHTLVEKPISIEPNRAEEMIKAEKNTDAIGMVSYMKRYDEIYKRFKSDLPEKDDVNFVRAYDVDPDHLGIISERYDIVGGMPTKPRIEQTGRRKHVQSAIDSTDEEMVVSYDFQIEHVCHDLNLLRDLFGDVEEIESAKHISDKSHLVADLTYGASVHCELVSGYSEKAWFEENVRVDTDDSMFEIEFENPFIRNSPTRFNKCLSDKLKKQSSELVSADDSFRSEINYFLECCNEGKDPRTTFKEAKKDVELLIRIFNNLS